MEIIYINIVVSVIIYLSIAFVLVIVNGKKKNLDSMVSDLKFDELSIDYSDLSDLERYECRDGEMLEYRDYSSKAEDILILIHGSGWHSQYFYGISNYLSENNIAKVFTPNLRGHGVNPVNRGDIRYINQLEDDLADFIEFIKKENPESRIILGGHSSGGGMVIRFGGSKYSDFVDAYILLSPFLKYNAPTMKSESGGWAYARMPRIIGLSMLNNVYVNVLNHLPVIDFNMPKDYRDGSETLSYSYRLNTGYAPRNYKKDLVKITKKMLVVAGTLDESFEATKFSKVMSEFNNDIEFEILPGVSHMGVVVGEEIKTVLSDWIKRKV